jgi:hypothetical protein
MHDPRTSLSRKQRIGAVGAAAGFAVIGLTSLAVPRIFAGISPNSDDVGARLAFALHWLLIPGLALLIGIIGAARRGFYPDAIDGTRAPKSHGLEINLRYNLNTVEQTVLAAIAWMGLAVSLPHDALPYIPAAATLFGVGRLTFWLGYLVYPIARSFGMVLTVAPTIAAFLWLTYHFFPVVE